MSLPIAPPPLHVEDDYAAADPARKRFSQKSSLSRYLSLPNLRRKSSKLPQPSNQSEQGDIQEDAEEFAPHHVPEATGATQNTITLHGPDNRDEPCEQDRYEWAILYENQRGMTVFSIPYYSKLSLLPNDPPPFTMPNTSSKRSNQPPLSLTEYPLPDGRWRWVSKAWMIDMRSDTGEVQHDGFEYNWVFRQHKWRAEVGPLSAGGWVRRRRWVRLMMRPGQKKQDLNESERSSLAVPSSGDRQSSGSLHSSLHPSSAERSNAAVDAALDSVWMGETEEDWNRCHSLLKRFDRDGRKLEIWKWWLSYYPANARPDVKGKGREHPTVAAEEAPPIPKQWIAAVVKTHADSILHMFIYPDSRAELLHLFKLTMPEVFEELGLGQSQPEFWSYGNEEAADT
ncbi:hypothetical protein BDN72DRAFT_26721 [Pluteus cervinus]|uniref:Uncharacterized protein n=1 Tax=Pluteus cervinus TaxID=181527 RepID=A0ACD3BGC9_9AGAR|nr:hypothetical protein BDN72DRAFT_26721 [Pluteus cervinus]